MSRYLIGRSVTCDIVVNDPSVSRTHAELVTETNKIYVRDLDSSNGTFVNGTKISGIHYLNEFDIIKIGNTLLPWKNYIKNNIRQHEEAVKENHMNRKNQPSAMPMIPVPVPNSTASLVLGIFSIVFSCLFIGLILGIIGISISTSGKKLYQSNPTLYTNYNTLKAGMICSIIGTVIGALYTIYYIVLVIFLGAAFESIFNNL